MEIQIVKNSKKLNLAVDPAQTQLLESRLNTRQFAKLRSNCQTSARKTK